MIMTVALHGCPGHSGGNAGSGTSLSGTGATHPADRSLLSDVPGAMEVGEQDDTEVRVCMGARALEVTLGRCSQALDWGERE